MAQQRLFDLIKTMSGPEKRHFSIHASKHVIGEKNQYLELFKLIDRMDTYDDEKVKAAPFVKNSAAEKNYLYRLILKSLNSFHAQHSDRMILANHLQSIEVLKQRGLYDQALRIVSKASALAEKKELFRDQLLLHELEQELLLKKLDYKSTLLRMETDKSLLKSIDNLLEMTSLTTQGYFEGLSKGVARSSSDLTKFEELVQHPLLTQEYQALSKRARLHQISVKLTYHMMRAENEDVLKQSTAILAHYNEHQHLIDYTPVGYVSSHFIKGGAQRDSNRLSEALETVEAIKLTKEHNSVKRSSKALASAFFYEHILRLQVMVKQGRFEEAPAFIEEAQSNLNVHLPFIGRPQLYDLYFQMAKIHFVLEQYRQALKYTNIILNDAQFKARENFGISVRLFNLLIHFELNNALTLDYLSRNTYNYLKKKNKRFKVETHIIRFIEHSENYHNKGTYLQELALLWKNIKEYRNEEFEQVAFLFFNFSKWVESKQLNRPLSEVYSTV